MRSSVAAAPSAEAASAATPARPSRPSVVRIIKPARSAAKATWMSRPSSRSSRRQVVRMASGRPARRRARYATTSSDEASIHWTSSIRRTPGAGPPASAVRTSAMASRSRARPKASPTPAAAPDALAPGSGTSRATSARASADTLASRSTAPGRSRPDRIKEAVVPNAIAASPTCPGASRTPPPAARTRAVNSAAKRVFPIPGSPSITNRRPSGPMPRYASSMAASSVSRPINRVVGAAVAARSSSGSCVPARGSGVPGRLPSGIRPARIASYRSVVSDSGATPNSASSSRTQSRYWPIAAATSPARA